MNKVNPPACKTLILENLFIVRGDKNYLTWCCFWIIFTLFLLIMGAGALVYFKAESYINKNLSNIVAEKSDGLYELAFEEIKLKRLPILN